MDNKRRGKLLGRILRTAEIPEVAGGKASRIELDGGNEMLVEGCEAVLEYGDERIVLRLCDRVMAVEGQALEISGYGEKNLRITGNVVSVSLTEG